MNELFKTFVKRRLTSPNNATQAIVKILEKQGYQITHLDSYGKRSVATIGGKEYAITTTSRKLEAPECRQLTSSEGILTFYEKTGELYCVDKEFIRKSACSREMNGIKFYNSKSLKKFNELMPLTKLIERKDYEVICLEVLIELQDELIDKI